MESVTEEWRQIPGFEIYEASNLGRVRSIDRWSTGRGGARRWARGKILKGVPHKGYLACGLFCRTSKKVIVRDAHQWVLRAWLGPPPTGYVTNHKNGVKTDNNKDNLEYITNSANVLHAYATGLLSNTGERNGYATTTERQVRMIRAFPENMPRQEMADRAGCSKKVVSDVLLRKTWSHVQ